MDIREQAGSVLGQLTRLHVSLLAWVNLWAVLRLLCLHESTGVQFPCRVGADCAISMQPSLGTRGIRVGA